LAGRPLLRSFTIAPWEVSRSVLNQARQSYGVQATSTAQNAFNRSAQAKGLYGAALAQEEGAQRGLQQFNAAQKTNEQLSQAGMVTGGIGAYAGTVAGEEAAGVGTTEFNLLLEHSEIISRR